MTLPFESARISPKRLNRRGFIGGSDARIIMGRNAARPSLRTCPTISSSSLAS